MLNPEICKKCKFKAVYSVRNEATGVGFFNWMCLHGNPRIRIEQMTSPPKECPKILEHAVAEGMRDAK